MATVNDHTRKMVTTAIKPTTDAYRDGWDRIFRKQEQQPKVCRCALGFCEVKPGCRRGAK